MSEVIISRLVANMKERTNVYTPLVEAVVNSIQAIEDTKRKDGLVTIRILRSSQDTLLRAEGELPAVIGFEIEDNGVGFTKENRDSFNTIYSDKKSVRGGKGFGRFTYLKYFDEVKINSIYEKDGKAFRRIFTLGQGYQIIENESDHPLNKTGELKTVLTLDKLKHRSFEKKIETIARKLLEKILVYFIIDDAPCPRIVVEDPSLGASVDLNEILEKKGGEIELVSSDSLELTADSEAHNFSVNIFKIYYPDQQNSKISLVANHREVTEIPIQKFIPEFVENFFDVIKSDSGEIKRDYRIKTFVRGPYLDKHVSLERTSFDFPKGDRDNETLFGFTEDAIARRASEMTKKAFPDEVKSRKEKKEQRIKDYVNTKAPWHKSYVRDLEWDIVPYHLNDGMIEGELQRVKYRKEQESRAKVDQILSSDEENLSEKIATLARTVSEIGMSDLTHYVALRRVVLDLFKKSLEIDADGKYKREDAVHDIIFPTKSDSETTPYEDHNLWIVDEKLNFTEFLASDKPLGAGNISRPDILIFNQKNIAVRGGDEPSNPITIFEFKRPQREDFADRGSKEDPIDQIINYVNDLRDGKYKTPQGKEIRIAENTPFYGYVVCELTQKVRNWLRASKNFKEMPDGAGWFNWQENINLYIEVVSWDKLLKDAEQRNRIFFEKLKIT